jgi:hypothetical protein
MELEDFLLQIRTEVRQEIADSYSTSGSAYAYEESVFTEVVMEHMSEIGMTFQPEICHLASTIGKARLRLSGYAVSEDGDQLDLFVSLYEGVETITPIPDSETRNAAEQCHRFLRLCAEGRLAGQIDQSNDAYPVAHTIKEVYPQLDQIRIYVLTDRQAKAKCFKTRELMDKQVKLEVMDIERLWRHWSEGKPRDELVVNFEAVSGGALPCVYVPGDVAEYDYALTAFPGEALRFIYEKYGPRLLEANVRSFLSSTGRVNKGISETLKKAPERFMAYNNGIVIVADEMHLGRAGDGTTGILWLKGMQIVNGGQTTATLFFTKKKDPKTDLSRVRVPAKIIVLRFNDPLREEELISDISKYANSQNSVKQSDLSANKPFHIRVEQLSQTTYCPDGTSRWFYERAAGSYKTLLAREGTTPAKLRKLRTDNPSTQKITKTDLAKYINAWDGKPHLVSLGSQKNFERFQATFSNSEDQTETPPPDVAAWKKMVAKAILFKSANKLIRPTFSSYQANVTAYTVSLLSARIGDRLDLDRIWQNQKISTQLEEQILIWAHEVNKVLHQSANGRMISEWAKKLECWQSVFREPISPPIDGIPELR